MYVYFQEYDFTADDLVDEGEIGRGAFGTVNKMYHELSNTLMAVKVSDISQIWCVTSL